MPSFVIPEKCDGCKALDKTACQYICPNDLMVLDKETEKAGNHALYGRSLAEYGQKGNPHEDQEEHLRASEIHDDRPDYGNGSQCKAHSEYSARGCRAEQSPEGPARLSLFFFL